MFLASWGILRKRHTLSFPKLLTTYMELTYYSEVWTKNLPRFSLIFPLWYAVFKIKWKLIYLPDQDHKLRIYS